MRVLVFTNIWELNFASTNFRDNLQKKQKKEIKRTKFCNFVFVFILSTGHLSQLNKTYIFQSKIVNLQLPYIEPYEQDKT